MKKLLFAIFVFVLSTPVFAQQEGGGQNEQQGDQGQNQQRFDERKQHILERMNQRLEKLQSAINCINQAQNPQALKACRPQGNQNEQDN